MKSLSCLLFGALWLLSLAVAPAQNTNSANAAGGKRNGQVVVPERPTATDANVGSGSSLNPGATEKQQHLPAELKLRLERFKLDARAYLAQQELLKKKMVGANDQEREALREQLRSLREEWLERARDMREEYKDRKDELEMKLRDHRELFDEIRGSAAERRRETGDRPRRGTD